MERFRSFYRSCNCWCCLLRD